MRQAEPEQLVLLSQAMLTAAQDQAWDEVAQLDVKRQVVISQWTGRQLIDPRFLEPLARVEKLNEQINWLACARRDELAASIQRQRQTSAGTRAYQHISGNVRAPR